VIKPSHPYESMPGGALFGVSGVSKHEYECIYSFQNTPHYGLESTAGLFNTRYPSAPRSGS